MKFRRDHRLRMAAIPEEKPRYHDTIAIARSIAVILDFQLKLPERGCLCLPSGMRIHRFQFYERF